MERYGMKLATKNRKDLFPLLFLQYDVLGYKYLSDGNSSNKFIFIISMFVGAVDGGVRNRTFLKTGTFQKRFEL
ncbi:hypothetical protein QR98_0051760 [Sarcoptes scabiei]|uniref:Uncharacterized protein n=1 Tax=Sarcoptes scabiei TaxID=52283 RepID=A0A132A6V7_SARSC|nr:hypothetical protein QR98_0051760 [Sarcoptes scabiei]